MRTQEIKRRIKQRILNSKSQTGIVSPNEQKLSTVYEGPNNTLLSTDNQPAQEPTE